ncbi:TetR/AcrR family transcriptional regulator [Metabacillus litoralis]|uniref:TetR/AcrR family transcriptional regulator n=1 Tax=Metabacillus litoralis TaxID=152268 RepID=UPI001CFF47E4|nr:TetR/AcrR family transcriptional regulator [Metabacillus litoralis]
MDTKKRLIIEKATIFFAEKGYHSTSVQEIAEQCSMSKASLYKFFSSKEELFIEVFEYHQNTMFEKVATYSFDPSLSPKELFIKQLCIQIEDFVERRDFILMQLKEIPLTETNKQKNIMKRLKTRILLWQTNMLIQAYGEEIKPYIWDITITLQGIVKEYISQASEYKHLNVKNIEEIATYLVDRIDTITGDLLTKKPTPLFTKEMLLSDFNMGSSKHSPDMIHDHLRSIEKYILTLDNKTHREKLAHSLAMLKEELKSPHRRVFLIEALLHYFKKEDQLASTTDKLRLLILGG